MITVIGRATPPYLNYPLHCVNLYIVTFPNMLGHITVDTIYAKMTKDYGDYTIPLIPRKEALC